MSLRTEGPLSAGKPHPRSYGTNARFIERMVLERNVVGLEEAIRKMTALPARRLGWVDRGLVRTGQIADLTVFDSATVADKATFLKPHQHSVGILHVLVAGTFVLKNRVLTGHRPGRPVGLGSSSAR